MRGNRIWVIALAIVSAILYCAPGFGQALVSEDFVGTGTTNPWYFFNGACLTASSATQTVEPGKPPGCTAISYYGENLVGGYNGVAGSAATLPDPVGYGALRFTNGCISGSSCGTGGHSQNGAIISANTYSTDQGLDITFKTVTYRGDSGGNGAGCPSGSTASNGQCVGTTSTAATATYSCSSGYTLSGSTCTETTTPTCSGNGYTLSGGVCVKSGHSNQTPTCPGGYTLSGSSCTKSTSATATYSCPSGYTLSGTNCTESTIVEATAPNQSDGADGMSFFLVNGNVTIGTAVEPDGTSDNVGSWGGSLGYTCSNANPDWHGM